MWGLLQVWPASQHKMVVVTMKAAAVVLAAAASTEVVQAQAQAPALAVAPAVAGVTVEGPQTVGVTVEGPPMGVAVVVDPPTAVAPVVGPRADGSHHTTRPMGPGHAPGYGWYVRNSPSPQQSLNNVGGAEMVRALLTHTVACAPQRHV